MYKAFEFRIYPEPEQALLINKTFGCARKVYNLMLAEKKKHYDKTGKMPRVTPAQYKAEYPYLKEVDSLALANEQLHLEAAYRNFFRDPSVGPPQFKSRKTDRRSYTTNLVNGNIRIEGKHLILPKLGQVKLKQHRNIPEEYHLKSCTVSQRPSGSYYVSLLYEYEAVAVTREVSRILGLDFSMTELYVTSEGEHGEYPHYYRSSQEKLRRMQRSLSRMERGSQNYKKQRRKIARLHEHIASQRRDFQHNKARQIANEWDLVGIESLNMDGMKQALHFGKSASDNGWGAFVEKLTYKLAEQGKKLVKIGRWYPSSKLCSKCGRMKESLPLSERTYHCECGNEMDRDYNAAVNIREEARRIYLAA